MIIRKRVHVGMMLASILVYTGIIAVGMKDPLQLKGPVRFQGNDLYLKGDMPCTHVILKPRHDFNSKLGYFDGSRDQVSEARLVLMVVTPSRSQVIKEVKIFPQNQGFPRLPYVHLYFDNAGGMTSARHYLLAAVRTIFENNVIAGGGQSFRDESVSVESLFEVVDINTRGCESTERRVRIELGKQ